MANDLAIIEKQLRAYEPKFADVLKGSGVAPERITRTVTISLERLPKLFECDRTSIFQSAMSAAVLGLEVDGITGQAFLIPFKGRAQLVIGYRGFATMAGRSGITINGDVVREGDAFDYEGGSTPFVRHKKLIGGGPDRRVVAAWATATAPHRTPVVSVLDLNELLAVKNRSPGAKKADSPWNDAAVGFPAMCAKTPRRRLAKDIPLNVFQLGARLDQAYEEEGRHAYIDPERVERGLIVDGVVEEIGDPQPGGQPSLADLKPKRFVFVHFGGRPEELPTIGQWRARIEAAVRACRHPENVEALRDNHAPYFDEYSEAYPAEVKAVIAAIDKRLEEG
jgi:recombination protein RecT